MATDTIYASGNLAEAYDFTVKARTVDGQEVTRKAKAARAVDVTDELLKQGLVPISITGGPSEGGLNTEITFRKRAKHKQLVIATRLLATMYGADLPPAMAFDVVIDDCPDEILKRAFTEVREQVINGVPLSEAMASQEAFPPGMINFIVAGEAAGDIKSALNRVADQFHAEAELRAKVRKAMAYPVIVFSISIVVFLGMMLFLIPSFAAIFYEIGGPDAKLPLLTRMVIGASKIMKWTVLPGFIAAIVGGIAYRLNSNKPGVRAVVDPFKLKVPIFGRLFTQLALARFCRNFAGLTEAGVDRLEALNVAAKTIGNVVYEEAALRLMEFQRQGGSLLDGVKEDPLWPTLIVQMINAGEQSGKTGTMLTNAADIYDREVNTITDNMAAIIEPIFLLVLGIGITIIVLAMYMPYLSLGTLISDQSTTAS